MTDATKLLILIDPSSGVPVYRQLMDQVKFLVAGGVLQPGDPLPSTRTLSAELGVNPMTISKAYSFLERDGVVERRPGRPLVVKAFRPRQIQDQKLERLRESLAPTVNTVRQLAIEREDALRLFGEMLDEGPQAGDAGEETP